MKKLNNYEKQEGNFIYTLWAGKMPEVAKMVALETEQVEAAVVTADLTHYAGVQYAAPAAVAASAEKTAVVNVEVYIDTLHVNHTLTMEGQGWAQGWHEDFYAQKTVALFDDPEFGSSFNGTNDELLSIMNVHDAQQFTLQQEYSIENTFNGVHVAESFSAQRTVEVYKGEVTIAQ